MTDRRSLALWTALRWLLVFCQAATILIAWPLWQVRVSPPLLPILAMPQFDFGMILLGSLALILIRPRLGIICHASLIGLAILLDQTRLQPQIISHLFLLWGTLSSETGKTVCRAHLIAVWFFGGFHKMLSPAFFTEMSRTIWTGLFPDAPVEYASWFGGGIALAEMILAILAIVPETRRFAAKLAVCIHLAILLTLSPWGINFNQSIWPWNVSLAFAGYAMMSSWQGDVTVSLQRVSVAVRFAVFLLVFSPLLYYVGLLDAYMANCLYASNYPLARITAADGQITDVSSFVFGKLKSPLPPTHRHYEHFFSKVAQPGDSLEITDSRLWFRWRGQGSRKISYDQIAAQRLKSNNRLPASANHNARILAE